MSFLDSGRLKMIQLEGRNLVYEALKARRVTRLLIAKEVENDKKIKLIVSLAKTLHIEIVFTNITKLERMSEIGRHQGIIAHAIQSQNRSLKATINNIRNDLCILLLDGLQDPRNLGAILRTAESTNTTAIIIPKRNSVSLTPAVHRTSMGGSLYVPVYRENLHFAIKNLKNEGIRVIGVDPIGENRYFSEDLSGAIAFLLGGEDKGINRNLLGKCNRVVSIPMFGKIESLNVSVSAALILYERLRQRIYEGKNYE